jgi:hypothetical protein
VSTPTIGARLECIKQLCVAGSTPGLDFYILCEPICVSLCLYMHTHVDGYVFQNFVLIRQSLDSYGDVSLTNLSELIS